MNSDDLKLWLRRQPWMQTIRLGNLRRRQRVGLYPDWHALLGEDWPSWTEMRAAAADDPAAPRVLLATSVGIHAAAATFDSYLAVALTARGARCDSLLCDAALPACMAADYTWYPDASRFARQGSLGDLCTTCFAPADRLFGTQGLGLEVIRYSRMLSDPDRARARAIADGTQYDSIPTLELDGIAIGEAAMSGALRFFARGELDDTDPSVREAIVRRYLEAACLSLFAMRRLVSERRYDVIVGHHGIYVPQALVAAAAKEAGVRFVAWNPAYRTGCFIFSHTETYHRAMLTEPTAAWEGVSLTAEQQNKLMRYLGDRATGKQDWIAFHRPDVDATSGVISDLGLDPAKPTVIMLTSVIWDAQLHYRQRAFKSQVEWALQTVRHFAGRSDIQLAIRVHPAEERGSLPSRQPIAAEIRSVFPVLPPNVVLIEPNERISTYALSEACDAAIIYATKTGIELAARGIPVIVAGESWLKGKEIGFDCNDPSSYEKALADLPFRRRMDPDRIRRARAYAYHFFFRRMIPVPAMRSSDLPGLPYKVEPTSLVPLQPGGSAALDIICNGILGGSPFINNSG